MFGLGVLELLVLALAAYRLTILFTQDRITHGLRQSVMGSQAPAVRQWGGGLFGCNNCFGVWASAAVLLGWVYLAEHEWIRVLVIVFAVAGASLLFGRVGYAGFGAPPARSPVGTPPAPGAAGVPQKATVGPRAGSRSPIRGPQPPRTASPVSSSPRRNPTVNMKEPLHKNDLTLPTSEGTNQTGHPTKAEGDDS